MSPLAVATLALSALLAGGGCDRENGTEEGLENTGASGGESVRGHSLEPRLEPGPESLDSETDVGSSALAVLNADAVLEAVFDVIAGRVYDERFVTLRRSTDGIPPSSIETVLRTERDAYDVHGYACPDGGAASLVRRVENSGDFDDSSLQFDDCALDGYMLDGSAGEFVTAYGDFRHRFDALALVDADGHRAELDGTISRTLVDDWGSGNGGLRLFSVDDLTLVTSGPGMTLELREAQTSLLVGIVCPKSVGCYDRAGFRASFTLRATSLAGGRELRVETTQPFGNDGGSALRFDQGTLQVDADDGSGITLEAGNGDPSSATVTVVSADGEPGVYELPWTDVSEPLEFVR